MDRTRRKGKIVLPLNDNTADKAIKRVERESIKPKKEYTIRHIDRLVPKVKKKRGKKKKIFGQCVCMCGKRMSKNHDKCFICRKKEVGLWNL